METILYMYEPAMCCETGVCGVATDPELLRISTVINQLAKKGCIVKRFNLASHPMEFANNELVKDWLNSHEISALPISIWHGEIIAEGRYLTNDELSQLFNVPLEATSNMGSSCCDCESC
ncbi:arsenite efflux transporter metallochaperone ArsD [Veillonella criceti]|uniref:Arsenical resistance operon trans-acting repressor ArsD n=1 Tax=Veillonella criceti TaxID=103891 RepID=A0A380NMH7_9FIRM|nr:arsenite efflux transporter metallochaperone ArsD [Veillonella criceti]SUP43383.1 Arsenical resistance operon trans-acting repressor ArsD [Veillonella criceti]